MRERLSRILMFYVFTLLRVLVRVPVWPFESRVTTRLGLDLARDLGGGLDDHSAAVVDDVPPDDAAVDDRPVPDDQVPLDVAENVDAATVLDDEVAVDRAAT